MPDGRPCERFVVDAVFADQVAPGRPELALRELPEYIESLRIAKASSPA